MLEKDIPVIFSVGPNTPDIWGKVEINLYNQLKKGEKDYDNNANELYQYKSVYYVNGHYMTITGIIIDDIAKNTMLCVSSWGEKYYIDYDEYREYIDNSSGTWSSSMIYIK